MMHIHRWSAWLPSPHSNGYEDRYCERCRRVEYRISAAALARKLASKM